MSNQLYQHYTVVSTTLSAFRAEGPLKAGETYYRFVNNEPRFYHGEITRRASEWFEGFPSKNDVEEIRHCYPNLDAVELLDGETGQAQVHHIDEFVRMYEKADAIQEFNALTLRIGLEMGNFAA